MGTIYEDKFKTYWKPLEDGTIKLTAHLKDLNKAVKALKDQPYKACKDLDKAISEKKEEKIKTAIVALKKSVTNTQSTIASILKDRKDEFPDNQSRTFLGTFKTKLDFLTESADDAILALQNSTLEDIAGSEIILSYRRAVIDPAVVSNVASEKLALLNPSTSKPEPKLLESVKAISSNCKKLKSVLDDIHAALKKKTTPIKAKTYLEKQNSDAFLAVRDIDRACQDWIEHMAVLHQKAVPSPLTMAPKVEIYQNNLKLLMVECKSAENNLAKNERAILQIGR